MYLFSIYEYIYVYMYTCFVFSQCSAYQANNSSSSGTLATTGLQPSSRSNRMFNTCHSELVLYPFCKSSCLNMYITAYSFIFIAGKNPHRSSNSRRHWFKCFVNIVRLPILTSLASLLIHPRRSKFSSRQRRLWWKGPGRSMRVAQAKWVGRNAGESMQRGPRPKTMLDGQSLLHKSLIL